MRMMRNNGNENDEKGNMNGILGDKDPLNKYYAYGIRNAFGIDFDPVTKKTMGYRKWSKFPRMKLTLLNQDSIADGLAFKEYGIQQAEMPVEHYAEYGP